MLTICKICGENSDYWASAEVLKKYSVKYYKCSHCEFIQTENPYWLGEAYQSVITKSDIGLLSRNIAFVSDTKLLIEMFFRWDADFLDYGGGYGIFTRLMRDAGYKFYRDDPYAKNIFAENFDHRDGMNYELVTAFEVFEHLPNPMNIVRSILDKTDSVFFSTTLLPDPTPLVSDWWYYGREHGQHVSFYSVKTLQYIAKLLGLNFYTNANNLHLFTKKKISPLWYRLCFKYKNIILRKIYRKILLLSDFQNITGVIVR